MRAEDVLAAAARLPVRPVSAIASAGRGLVVVAPHADDESLGCGALMAAARRGGIPVRLIIVSDGTGSHPNSVAYPPGRLRDLREREARAAAGALGLRQEQVTYLRLPDRFVPRAGPLAAEAVRRIAAAARAVRAAALMVTWAHDPHCDHQACAVLARRAARGVTPPVSVYAYPVWGWTLPPDLDVGGQPLGFRLPVEGLRARKRRAIRAHRSQTTTLIADDPQGFMLDPRMRERFETAPHEIFIRMRP